MLIRRQRIAIEAAIVLIAATWLIIYAAYASFTVPGPRGQVYWLSPHAAKHTWDAWELATTITIALVTTTLSITLLLGRNRSRLRVAISTSLLALLGGCGLIYLVDRIYYTPLGDGLSYRYAADGTRVVWDAWETATLASLAIVALSIGVVLLMRPRSVGKGIRMQRIVASSGLGLIALTSLFPYVSTIEVHDRPPREIRSSGGGTIMCGCGSMTFDQHHCFFLSVDGMILWRNLIERWTTIAVIASVVVVLIRLHDKRHAVTTLAPAS